MAQQKRLSAMTLVGLGVLGMMTYAFIAPKLLHKPVPVVPAEAAGAAVPDVIPEVDEPLVGVPNNAAVPTAEEDLNMNFAGVAFAENIPGLSYGFPMAGIV